MQGGPVWTGYSRTSVAPWTIYFLSPASHGTVSSLCNLEDLFLTAWPSPRTEKTDRLHVVDKNRRPSLGNVKRFMCHNQLFGFSPVWCAAKRWNARSSDGSGPQPMIRTFKLNFVLLLLIAKANKILIKIMNFTFQAFCT